jgi:hypothetical protein
MSPRTASSTPSLVSPRLRRMSDLDEVLAFECEHVLHKFRESFSVTLEQAREIFTEVKRWLWASELGVGDAGAPRFEITHELVILDEMWHAFILFTAEYHAFCDRYFGRYLHHAPTTKAEKDAWAERRRADPEAFVRERLARKRALYGFVYDRLGPDVLRRWYLEFPARYGEILQQRRPSAFPPLDGGAA